MDLRFYEIGLRHVASGLIELSRPTPGAIDHLVGQLDRMASIAADAGRGIISRMAQEAQSALEGLPADRARVRPTCIEAMGRLGQHLLEDLCAQARQTEPVPAAPAPQPKVLIVDDSRVVSTALVRSFQARQCVARTAVTLEEVFVELVHFAPSVLVSDVFMPDLEVELLARVFRSLSRGRPKVLALVSSTSGASLDARVKDIQPDIFVSKMEGSAVVVEKVIAIWNGILAPSGVGAP